MTTATPSSTGTSVSEEEVSENQAEQQAAMQQLHKHIRGESDDDVEQQHVNQILEDIISEGTNLTKEEEEISPTALRLDSWDMRRGREIAKENKRLKEAEIDEIEAADFHAACFQPEPELHPRPANKLMSEYMQQLMTTTDYLELHDTTMGDDFASEVAAAHFGDAYAKLRKQQSDINKENAERAAKGQGPKTGPGSQPNVVAAVASAMKGASQSVQEYKDACEAMGWGEGEGMNDGKIDPARVSKMMERVNKSQNLKKILEWAGRFKIVASSCQREKIDTGNDELVGVVPNDAIHNLLPQELAYLDDELLEPIFFSRLMEKKTLCRQYEAKEPQGRGPIVVIVDESGSMSGQRIETAKGMMLAIGWIARKQKRWLTLGAFSHGPAGRIETFDTGAWDENRMLGWMEGFINGGTSLDLPFKTIPDYLDRLPNCPKGKIDFILITDGEMGCSEELKASFTKWKLENKVRLLSIIIEMQPGILGTISDEVYQVNSLSLDSEATHAAFSI